VIYLVSTTLSFVVLALAMLVPKFGGWQNTVGDFLFVGCSSVLISPIAWEHHYGYFFFLIAYLLARATSLSAGNWGLLCACTIALANRLPPLDHRMRGGISVISSYTLYSGIATLWLLAKQQRKRQGLSRV
jgi:hypothetical protein